MATTKAHLYFACERLSIYYTFTQLFNEGNITSSEKRIIYHVRRMQTRHIFLSEQTKYFMRANCVWPFGTFSSRVLTNFHAEYGILRAIF